MSQSEKKIQPLAKLVSPLNPLDASTTTLSEFISTVDALVDANARLKIRKANAEMQRTKLLETLANQLARVGPTMKTLLVEGYYPDAQSVLTKAVALINYHISELEEQNETIADTTEIYYDDFFKESK